MFCSMMCPLSHNISQPKLRGNTSPWGCTSSQVELGPNYKSCDDCYEKFDGKSCSERDGTVCCQLPPPRCPKPTLDLSCSDCKKLSGECSKLNDGTACCQVLPPAPRCPKPTLELSSCSDCNILGGKCSINDGAACCAGL